MKWFLVTLCVAALCLIATPPPPGVAAITAALSQLYPGQEASPYHRATTQPYWMGGREPLDWIKVHFHPRSESNKGSDTEEEAKEAASPAHWHFVSCGLSDLYGDGRLHEISSEDAHPSGFGIELTLRVACPLDQESLPPPAWPVGLLQKLARYVYSTQTVFSPGDHIPWNKSINDQADSSCVRHMILIPDRELNSLHTPLGRVQFVQVLGVTEAELQVVQRASATAVAAFLARSEATGGWLGVTDTTRTEQDNAMSLPDFHLSQLETSSNLSGVVCLVTWTHLTLEDTSADTLSLSPLAFDSFPQMLDGDATPVPTAGSTDTLLALVPPLTYRDGVHLLLSASAKASLLSVVVQRRLLQGRHFTFLHPKSEQAVTFVPPGVTGSFVDATQPIVARGRWLQIFTTAEFLHELQNKLSKPPEREESIRFSSLKLKLSFLPDISPALSLAPTLLPPM